MADEKPDVRAIFCRALELKSPAKVAEYLDEACGQDDELRAQVEALLSAHGEVGDFLGGGASSELRPTTDEPIAEQAGSVIGPYKLLQQIGEGGMGVVYMAEQTEPVERRVALKIIKLGMDTRQVIARFEAERQALALMDHPNITKVHDAGVTDSGRPYFVMELVRGVPITEYCDEQHLTAHKRLELFLPVCRAVQHAHQKGIIHRDLKPSNVMVAHYDDRPVPKVIDFGVVKAISQKLTEKTMFTQYGQIVGTLEYMSPEQARLNQLDIDTRSDIYSLGVLLYELLTGTTPFDKQRLRSSAFEEIMRIIREEEPPRPSTRLRSSATLPAIAANRGTEPRKLSALIHGELDWIVMKALEKDRTRRYETASALALDIEHYLHDEPVVACPPSIAYKVRKLARRHKGPAVAMLIFISLLIAGSVGTTIGLVRAKQAEGDAQREAERAEAAATQANEAFKAATESRLIAERADAFSRHQLYTFQMNVALHAWEAANVGQARELLHRNLPGAGQENRRGFEWYYLWRLCHRESATLNHWSHVHAVAFSPDGKLVASAGGESGGEVDPFQVGELKLWDAATGGLLATLVGHETIVFSLAFSPDGRTLASRGAGEVKLWDVVTGRVKDTLHDLERFGGVAYSPDGNVLAVAGKNLELVNMVDGQRRTLETNVNTFAGDSVVPAVFSSDGTLLASVSTSGKLKLWDLEKDRTKEFGEADPSRCLALSSDGTRLASASIDGSVRLWNVSTGEPIQVLEGHSDSVVSLDFSPDGQILASASLDNTVRVWQLNSGTTLETLRGHSGPVYCLAFGPDGNTLATGSRDSTLKFWDLHKHDHRASLRLHERNPSGRASQIADLAFSADASRLISCQSAYDSVNRHPTSTVKVCETSTGKQLAELMATEGCACVGFSPDGKPMAFGEGAGVGKLWDLQTHQELQTLPRGGLSCGVFSADGRALLSASHDGRLHHWHVATGEQLLDLQSHAGAVTCVAFSQDKRRVASAGVDQRIKVRDASSGRLLFDLGGNGAQVTSLAFCPTDEGVLASGDFDNVVRLWELESGKERARLEGHSRSVWTLAFSPDGKRLASGSYDGTVKLWDTPTGDELGTFKWHDESVVSLAFSPDGKTLASGSKDGMVILAHAATRAEVSAQLQERQKGQVQLTKELQAIESVRDAVRLYRLGLRQSDSGHYLDAEHSSQSAIELLQTTPEYVPVFGPSVYDALAWLLATCPDENLRRPEDAARLAEQAVQLRPENGRYWTTLGIARYRGGKWLEAIDALTVSQQLLGRDTIINGFFLSMSHWQLEDEDEARKWFDTATKLIEEESLDSAEEDELRRSFRNEATQLLNVAD